MNYSQPARDKSHLNRALEVSIHIGLIGLLLAACLVILGPFIAVVRLGTDHRHCRLPRVLLAAEATRRSTRLRVHPVYGPSSYHLDRADCAACSIF